MGSRFPEPTTERVVIDSKDVGCGNEVEILWGDRKNLGRGPGIGRFLANHITPNSPFNRDLMVILHPDHYRLLEWGWNDTVASTERSLTDEFRRYLRDKQAYDECGNSIRLFAAGCSNTAHNRMDRGLLRMDAKQLSGMIDIDVKEGFPNAERIVPEGKKKPNEFWIVSHPAFRFSPVTLAFCAPLFFAAHKQGCSNPEKEDWVPLLPFSDLLDVYYIGDDWWTHCPLPESFSDRSLRMTVERGKDESSLIGAPNSDGWSAVSGRYYYRQDGVVGSDDNQPSIMSIWKESQPDICYLRMGTWKSSRP